MRTRPWHAWAWAMTTIATPLAWHLGDTHGQLVNVALKVVR